MTQQGNFFFFIYLFLLLIIYFKIINLYFKIINFYFRHNYFSKYLGSKSCKNFANCNLTKKPKKLSNSETIYLFYLFIYYYYFFFCFYFQLAQQSSNFNFIHRKFSKYLPKLNFFSSIFETTLLKFSCYVYPLSGRK